ncbi:MAG: methyltransferase domain-containing protein, partial [Myxococcales bacterium]|nr:methyltransferase domain-containing protein [Myxococcales bacterium]
MSDIVEALERLLAMQPERQVDEALDLLDRLPPVHDEAWNSRFGAGSLFDAWSRTSIARGVHAALAEAIRPVVQRPGFVAVEVGAGNGRTWSDAWRGGERGTVVAVDPVPEAIEQLAAVLPQGVELVRQHARVEDIDLPDADLVVCSMTLHHLAGRSAAERAQHGFTGPGKREVLERFGAALRARGGVGLLVEADVDCELHLAPGDPALRDNILDSYVRRCARSILDDLATRSPPPELA